MKRIHLTSLGQIPEADISFGDLTVFVGEQASGKSILLQLVKLILDTSDITRTLKTHGFDWRKEPEAFLPLYFGEGMEGIWNSATQIAVDNAEFSLDETLLRKAGKKKESLFLIPAHRAITLKDGWPRPFTDYAFGDPYVVKRFSEQLRLLMETGLGSGESAIFPQEGRMNKTIRDAISKSIFAEAQVRLDKSGPRRRIVLDVADNRLPFMAWSAGQREFTPLLMGLYWLMPSGGAKKKTGLDWVIIEEPEMGLHPKAVSALLLIFLELLKRGYKVIVSTHSPQILELIWAMQLIVKADAGPRPLLDILGLNPAPFSKKLAETGLKKTFITYYFSRQKSVVNVKDISTLNPENPDEDVSDWGGLTGFSTKVSDIISDTMWRADL